MTPLALLTLSLVFPAVTPQQSFDASPTNGKAPREPLASARWPAVGLAREVSFHEILLEWTTSLDTSSRTLFVCLCVDPRHVERRVT